MSDEDEDAVYGAVAAGIAFVVIVALVAVIAVIAGGWA